MGSLLIFHYIQSHVFRPIDCSRLLVDQSKVHDAMRVRWCNHMVNLMATMTNGNQFVIIIKKLGSLGWNFFERKTQYFDTKRGGEKRKKKSLAHWHSNWLRLEEQRIGIEGSQETNVTKCWNLVHKIETKGGVIDKLVNQIYMWRNNIDAFNWLICLIYRVDFGKLSRRFLYHTKLGSYIIQNYVNICPVCERSTIWCIELSTSSPLGGLFLFSTIYEKKIKKKSRHRLNFSIPLIYFFSNLLF